MRSFESTKLLTLSVSWRANDCRRLGLLRCITMDSVGSSKEPYKITNHFCHSSLNKWIIFVIKKELSKTEIFVRTMSSSLKIILLTMEWTIDFSSSNSSAMKGMVIVSNTWEYVKRYVFKASFLMSSVSILRTLSAWVNRSQTLKKQQTTI